MTVIMKSVALFSLVLVTIVISGCIQTNQAESIVQQNSKVINENLQIYGLQMDSNYLSRDSENFWEVTVYDPYKGKDVNEIPETYCVVKAYINKSSKQVEYLFFGLLCPNIENSKCKNLNCYSISDEDQNFNDYEKNNLSEISKQNCDVQTVCMEGSSCVSITNTTCQEGLKCIYFPVIGIKCAQPNPCSYFKCLPWMTCTVTENYQIANVSAVGCIDS